MNPQLPAEIIEAYAFANTPAYLYRKLRASEYVTRLATRTRDDLIGIINTSRSENLESIALAYAALIALLRKNIDPSLVLLLPAAQKLEWASVLVSLYKQKVASTSVIKVNLPTVFASGSASPANKKLTAFTITKVPKT